MTGVFVLWVTAGDGCVFLKGAPQGLYICPCMYIHPQKVSHTHNNLSVPSTAWEKCVCFNRCLLYLSQKKWKSICSHQWAFHSFLFRWCLDNLWQVLSGVLLRSVVSLCSFIFTFSYFVLSLYFSPFFSFLLSSLCQLFSHPQTDFRDAAWPLTVSTISLQSTDPHQSAHITSHSTVDRLLSSALILEINT